MRKKLLSTILVASMIFGIVGCGEKETGNEQSSTVTSEVETNVVESTEEGPKEIRKLTMYPANANLTSGVVGGWAGEFLADYGFELEVWAFSDEKLNAILASQELPDIMYIQNVESIRDLVKNGQIVNYDDYMDKLPNIAGRADIQEACNYSRTYITEDAGLYAMPLQVGLTATATDTERNAVKLNWEVYEQIGAPEFKNMDELVDVLKQMKEAYPTTADGTPTYALHLFNSMDTNFFYGIFGYYAVNGINYHEGTLGDGIEYNDITDSFMYVLDDKSVFKEGLAFFNRLYREGLMDPESINTDRGTQHKKIEAGGALAGWAGVPGWEAAGYYPAFFEEVETVYSAVGNVLGGNTFVVVNAESENLEAALEFVNMMADETAIITWTSGPQGELWDYNADGIPVATEKGINWWAKGETAKLASGEDFAIFNTQAILGSANLHSEYGVPLHMQYGEELLAIKNETELSKKWQATTGYNNYREQIEAEGTLVIYPDLTNASKFVRTVTDDEKLIKSAAKEIIVNGAWRMVYAETDEAFEAIWDEIVAECDELGFDDHMKTRTKDWTEAIEIRDSFAE